MHVTKLRDSQLSWLDNLNHGTLWCFDSARVMLSLGHCINWLSSYLEKFYSPTVRIVRKPYTKIKNNQVKFSRQDKQ